jgi:hypothetical protein
VYASNKTRILLGWTGPDWEQRTVAELDSAMNDWLSSVPPHRMERYSVHSTENSVMFQCVGIHRVRPASFLISRQSSTPLTTTLRSWLVLSFAHISSPYQSLFSSTGHTSTSQAYWPCRRSPYALARRDLPFVLLMSGLENSSECLCLGLWCVACVNRYKHHGITRTTRAPWPSRA